MIKKFLKFTKVEHTAFSLPLLFTGAWFGNNGSFPQLKILLLVIIAAVGARIFGMSFNRIFDRKIDAQNPRTASREIPSGLMSIKAALFTAFAGLTAYIAACFVLGGVCITFSWVPLIPLLVYSLLKRFTLLCHFGIGLCLAIAPLGAFAASAGHIKFTMPALLFSLFVFFLISGADIIYALLDIQSDQKNGIYSIPAKFGEQTAQKIAAAVHLPAILSIIILLLITNGKVTAWITAGIGFIFFILMYLQKIPAGTRFFPISTLAGTAGAIAAVLSVF